MLAASGTHSQWRLSASHGANVFGPFGLDHQKLRGLDLTRLWRGYTGSGI